jgi:hypothetical protein
MYLAALAIALSASAWSQQQQPPKQPPLDPKQFTIDEKSIVIEDLGPTVSPKDIPAPLPSGGGVDPTVILNEMINIGSKIWDIIEKNKPVVDVKTQYATALPQGMTHWDSLSGWKPPKGTVYGFSAKNAYGITVINVRYQVLRTYGGSYKGKGQYLTAVAIEPLNVDVAWGYHFSLSAEVPDSSIVNSGTDDNPVAAMEADLHWQISTPIKDSQGKSIYYLQGDGGFQEVGSAFKPAYAARVEKALATWVQ